MKWKGTRNQTRQLGYWPTSCTNLLSHTRGLALSCTPTSSPGQDIYIDKTQDRGICAKYDKDPMITLLQWSLSLTLSLSHISIVFTIVHSSAAKNTQTGEDVAIKKVTKVFEKAILAKRALREVKLLRHFSGHENVCIFFQRTFPFLCYAVPIAQWPIGPIIDIGNRKQTSPSASRPCHNTHFFFSISLPPDIPFLVTSLCLSRWCILCSCQNSKTPQT